MEDFEEFQDYDEFQFTFVANPSQLPVQAYLLCFVTPHFDLMLITMAMYQTLWMSQTS